MTAKSFLHALHSSLIKVADKWSRFVPRLREAWENFKSKKNVNSNKCVQMIFQPQIISYNIMGK